MDYKKSYVVLSTLLLFLMLLVTGCVTQSPRDQKNTPELAEVHIYEPKESSSENLSYREISSDQEVIRIRKEPVVITFYIQKDKELGYYVFDFDHFEQIGFKWGESVIWECAYPFTIHLGWDSPFQKGVYTGVLKEDNMYRTEAAKVRKRIPLEARAIPFKYFVAAYIEKDDFVATYDPVAYFIPPDYDYYW